jgi:hypothetical protein
MAKSKKTTPPKEEKAKVHPELDGFEIKINSFGEITSNFSVDTINEFLNKNVADKKLQSDKGPANEAE